VPSSSLNAGAYPRITVRFPTAPADLVFSDVYMSGIPFYVEGEDQDLVRQDCQWNGKEQVYLTSSDQLEYKWVSSQGNLPVKGRFEAGSSTDTELVSPAVVFRLPPQLPAGPYSFTISCRWRDLGSPGHVAEIDPESPQAPVLTWVVAVNVTACSATIVTLTAPTLNVPGPFTPPNILHSPCCITSPQWQPGLYPRPNTIDLQRTGAAGRYIVLTAKYQDIDYFRRRCDDNQNVKECPEPGNKNEDYMLPDPEDHCYYTWEMQPVGSATGALLTPFAHEYATIFYATSLGDFDICVTVRDHQIQGMDPNECTQGIVPHRITILSLPLVVDGVGNMTDGLNVQLLPEVCGNSIRLYVNNDDDNRDGSPDNGTTNAVPNENDLYALTIVPLLPNPATELRIRVARQGTVRVFKNSNHSNVLLENDWIPVPGQVTVYLEGMLSNAQYAGTQIAIDLRDATPPAPISTYYVDCTVFGIKHITIEDGSATGRAFVRKWLDLPERERPGGLVGAGPDWTNHWWVDPGVNPLTDNPFALSSGGQVWNLSQRNRVPARLQITPRSLVPVKVWISCRDVDDNTYTLYGGTGSSRRDFFDPSDRGLSGAFPDAIREDNNDTVAVAAGPSRHGAIMDGVNPVAVVIPQITDTFDFDFVITYAPGDNFRLVASMASDMLPLGSSKVVASVPGDSGDSYSAVAERRAALLFRIADAPNRQMTAIADALPVPETTNFLGDHTACSPTITVRRRLWIEQILRAAPVLGTWNLFPFGDNRDYLAENQNGSMTRFITQIDQVVTPADGTYYEYHLRYKDNRYRTKGDPANTLTVPPLCRLICNTLYNTIQGAWGTSLGIDFGQFDNSASYNYWTAPNPTTFLNPLPPGPPPPPPPPAGVPVPLTNASFPGGYGPFGPSGLGANQRRGRLEVSGGTVLGEILGNTDETIAIRSPIIAPAIAPVVLPIEIQRPGGAWEANSITLMTWDPATSRTTITFGTPIVAPFYPDGSTLRLNAAISPAGWAQTVTTVGVGTATSVVVGLDANGVSFRIPALLTDDTTLQFVGGGAECQCLQPAVTSGGVGFNYCSYLFRDCCLGVEFLGAPYSTPRPFKKHLLNSLNPFVNSMPGADIWLGEMNESELVRGMVLSNPRLWTLSMVLVPDGHSFDNYDPDGDVGLGTAEDNAWGTSYPRLQYLFPSIFPDSGYPVVRLSPWVGEDWFRDMWPAAVVAGFAEHGMAGAATHLHISKARYAVHEIVHQLVRPGPDLEITGPGWELYGSPGGGAPSVVIPGPDTGADTGHHSIPGITSYGEKSDPVASPTVPLEYAITNLYNHPSEPFGGAVRGECIVSPYVVRCIKRYTAAPGFLLRP
jgi:hypothetical protein